MTLAAKILDGLAEGKPHVFPLGAKVYVDGRDLAKVKQGFPNGSAQRPWPHYKVDFIGGDKNVAVPFKRVGVEKKKTVRESKESALTGHERSDLIRKIWRSKHRDYRSKKGDETHPSVLVMGKKGGTELWPLLKTSDEDLLWLAKRDGIEFERRPKGVKRTWRGSYESAPGFGHLTPLREALSRLGSQS